LFGDEPRSIGGHAEALLHAMSSSQAIACTKETLKVKETTPRKTM
jgi:hypothetical protein